jgi:hypothetical protein
LAITAAVLTFDKARRNHLVRQAKSSIGNLCAIPAFTLQGQQKLKYFFSSGRGKKFPEQNMTDK